MPAPAPPDTDASPAAARRSTRHRIGWWVGVALIAAGLSLLGWFAWQYWGTNWVSHRKQHQLVQQFRHQQTQDRHAGTRLASRQVPEGMASALIRIPRFGKHYVVPVMEGTSQDILAEGFGHFTDTQDPGQVGNYALAGHRVTHGQPLRNMPELRPGDKIVVETARWTYTYRLDTDPNDLIVPFTAGWVLQPLPHNPDAGGVQPRQRHGQRLITLTTCSELFHTDNRMIAFGHLVSRHKDY